MTWQSTASSLLKWLGLLSFYGYIAALFILGIAGLAVPGWELRILYQLDLSALGLASGAKAILLHQYRFLKAIAVGYGLFALVFRREIFRSAVFNRVFLAILFGGAAGRTLSLIIDGRAHWGLVSFTVSEYIFGVLIFAYSRSTLERLGRWRL